MVFILLLIANTLAYQIPSLQILDNAPCQWNVSKYNIGTNTSSKTAKTINAVLEQTCVDGYQITLEDNRHYEFIGINKAKTSPIVIKGGPPRDGNNIWTTWLLNSAQICTIFLVEGDLTLQNIQFNFTLSDDRILIIASSMGFKTFLLDQ
ncbi:MAG: hypothetical protein EZS28_024910 [Streblomastix strix]|uniref:Uncharacterized protein n=1 Tax=Streblomastix strix TaxID=222440 RepID=A0A5J4VB13_9EUKA|nr:MAG: hypothetical protein EZS28_024910 [Streblomastix strix]